MRKLQLFCSLILTMLCFPVTAQIQEPVKFKTEWKELSANEAEIVFSATIEKGWHVYSTEIEEGGPTPATFNIDKIDLGFAGVGFVSRGTLIDATIRVIDTTTGEVMAVIAVDESKSATMYVMEQTKAVAFDNLGNKTGKWLVKKKYVMKK